MKKYKTTAKSTMEESTAAAGGTKAAPAIPSKASTTKGMEAAPPATSNTASESAARKTLAGASDEKKSSIPPISTKSNLPPTIITVDTSNGDGQHARHDPAFSAESCDSRTPKHANKASSTFEPRIPPEHSEGEHYHQQRSFFPPRPFGGGPTGAFQPHTRPSGHAPHVSPASGRYYAAFPPGGPYQQAPSFEYPPRMPHGGGPGMFPPPYPQHHTQWGPPPQYHGRPPPYHPPSHPGSMMGNYPPPPPPPPPPPRQPGSQQPSHHSSHQHQPPHGHVVSTEGPHSRPVSSSFDRSIRRNSDEYKPMRRSHFMEPDPPPQAHLYPHLHHRSSGAHVDGGSFSDDGSWRQLNQIQSVDEEEVRKRLAEKGDALSRSGEKQVNLKEAHSNSSSLTNSPTEGVVKKVELPDPPKMTSSLDSLASVSSAQQPLKTSATAEKHIAGGDVSFDLMKCESGSSALLLPTASHGILLDGSPRGTNTNSSGSKRPREDGKESPTSKEDKDETESRPSKKGRSVEEGRRSPSSSSPPDAHTSDSKEKSDSDHPSFPAYDKPLSYSYSYESIGARTDLPPMLTRPQSSASSTGTPMQVIPSGGERNVPSRQGLTQLASWDIHAQDSFGGHSASNALASNFSFSQDCPMPAPSNAGDPPPPPPHVSKQRYVDHSVETRNQSFDGGHYHGSFSRAETMSIESRGQGSAAEQRQGYHGHFPPHAPSWGSAGSYPHPSGYPSHPHPQYRMAVQPMVMRSFSHDSEHHRMAPFQPPSEFQAPPTNINRNRPARKETHILTTPFEQSKSGVFGWTKEEDMLLTEIMKKHKNPRDWEPIAKELDRNRSAKECNERWIRYLKPGVRKGQWTDQEDAIVMEAVTSSKEQPFTRWSDLAQRLPGRVGKQIRDRWVNHLNPNINHLPFSKEDDLLLWEGHTKLGKRWVEIATKYFKGSRSENHIKNRWYSASFKKFITNEFGAAAYNSKGGSRGTSPKKDSKKKHGKQGDGDDDDDDPTFPTGI